MLKPAAAKNFDEYTHQIFIPYISSHASRVDLVWDSYVADSLQGSARAKRGKGVCRRVVAAAAIPGNWQNFLRMDSNKTELFRFLSDAVLKSFHQDNKQVVITDREVVLSKPPLENLASLSPCSHEEVDSHMLLDAAHAAQHRHHKILIIVDTVSQTLWCWLCLAPHMTSLVGCSPHMLFQSCPGWRDLLYIVLPCKEIPPCLVSVCACVGPVIQQDDKPLNGTHDIFWYVIWCTRQFQQFWQRLPFCPGCLLAMPCKAGHSVTTS